MLRNKGHVPKTKGQSSELTSLDLTAAFGPDDHSSILDTFSSFCDTIFVSLLSLWLVLVLLEDSSLSLMQCYFLRV